MEPIYPNIVLPDIAEVNNPTLPRNMADRKVPNIYFNNGKSQLLCFNINVKAVTKIKILINPIIILTP